LRCVVIEDSRHIQFSKNDPGTDVPIGQSGTEPSTMKPVNHNLYVDGSRFVVIYLTAAPLDTGREPTGAFEFTIEV
jgi:hypothetical protein